MLEILEMFLWEIARYAIVLFEYVGVAVIIIAGIRGIVACLRRERRTRLILAEGLALGLEFKMGSEIMRTVVVRDLSEIAIVGGIVALRVVLAVVLHWEIKHEKEDLEMEKEFELEMKKNSR